MGKADSLRGHCAIVTGASGGIGMQFCRALAGRGCAVAMTDIDDRRLREAADALAKEFPGTQLYTFAADLTAPGIAGVFEDFCSSRGLDPDILINNAGIFAFAPLADMPEGKLQCFINLHINALTMLSRWFAMRRKEKGSGWILNMSSMSCWMPMPGLSMYASTKAYIRVLSRSLHYEMKDYGVKVTVACPGGIATDLFGLPDNLKRLAVAIHVLDTPERFARKAIRRMLRGKRQYINGWLNRLSIFFVAITPTPVRMLVKHRLLDKGITR